MDKFTGRRRATWQSTAPTWPFVLVAFVVVVVACLIASPFFGGVILGDGTAGGRAMVWFKTISNILLPALLAGVLCGALLHALFLGPAGRHGAMKWTGLLILAGALAGAPISMLRGHTADRVGYAAKLGTSVNEARAASHESEQNLYRRLRLLLRNDPFDPTSLAAASGLEDARKAIDGHKSLIAEARRDYGPGQVRARAALAGAIVDEMDREAVLERFDAAAVERKAAMEKMWAAHDDLIGLREQELQALTGNRGSWRRAPNGITVTSESLFNRIKALDGRIGEAFDAMSAAEIEVQQIDARTDAGIDRVLRAAV